MNDERKITASSGQSLVEAVVMVGMVVLMVSGLVAGTTASLRHSKNVQYKSKALKYSQEGIELTRKLRDSGWSEFEEKVGTWCVDASGNWADAGGFPCMASIESTYSRTITLTWDGSSKMTAEVSVAWSDGATAHTSTLTTIFTQWR